MSDRPSLPPGWEKVKVITTLVASILIPLAAVWISQSQLRAVKERELAQQKAVMERELNIRYVELAISVLSNEPEGEVIDLRDWAIEIVNNHSPTPLPDEVRESLKGSRLTIGNIGIDPGVLDEIRNNLKDIVELPSLQERQKALYDATMTPIDIENLR